MQLEDLDHRFSMKAVVVNEQDWDRPPASDLLSMAQQMILIRSFEKKLLELKNADLIHGPVHSSIGQEGVAIGAMTALRPGDVISGTHRAHHQYLAKAFNYYLPAGYNPLSAGIPESVSKAVHVLLAEIMGLSSGCCKGRGGSMHLYNPEVGVIGTNAIVGGGIPHATGAGFAAKYKEQDRVAVCFFGDGGLYQGVLHESANLASLWKIPVIYFIENNLYSVGTRVEKSCSAAALCEVAAAYEMLGIQVDGMNPLAVHLAVREVITRRDRGWLPCFIEAQTYRYFHHAGSIPGSGFGYRSKDEEAAWRARDPLTCCLGHLGRRGLIDNVSEKRLWQQADECVDRAVSQLTEPAGEGEVAVGAGAWPDTQSITTGLRDFSVAEADVAIEAEDIPCPRKIRYVEAISEVTGRWLEKDPRVFVMGEEVANMGGGAYGATRGLSDRFPGRVRNTPISEAGFVGLACGAALSGLRPIVEIMFPSFALVAADQLFNQIGQLKHIYGGYPDMPVVVRTRVAIGCGYGAQHSLDPVALFHLFPGWQIFAPSNPFDYIGLFNAAMMSRTPTIMVEHHELYTHSGSIPEGPLDFVVRPGKARLVRAGSAVTALSYSCMVHKVLEAAMLLESEQGIEVEILDLRTLDAAGLDYDSIGRSLMKTGALVTVEQAPASQTLGSKIAAECQRRFCARLDCPPAVVTGLDVPLPVSRKLETAAIPSVEQIASVIAAAARRQV